MAKNTIQTEVTEGLTEDDWYVKFTFGVQTFSLSSCGNKDDAKWVVDRLLTLFENFAEYEILKFAKWLKTHRGICEHTTPEFQKEQYFKYKTK